MRFIVVSGARELVLLADSLAKDHALLEQEHVQFFALVAAAVGVRHYERLLEQQLPLSRYVALEMDVNPFIFCTRDTLIAMSINL